MIYLSQVLKSKVRDSSDRVVGKLQDILIKPIHGSYAPLVFLLVQNKKEEYFIPYDYVENLSREGVTLKGLITSIPSQHPAGGQVYMNRDVLDQQIVDVAGARVVRVNDLRIGLFENKMCVLGIDVSFKGLLRRLGLHFIDFLNLFKVHLIDWRKAQPIKGVLKLDTVSKDLTKLHPADLANIIEDLGLKRAGSLVDSLDSAAAAKVLEELDPQVQKIMVKHLGPEKAARIVEKMSVDELVDLLQMFNKAEAGEFLSYLKNGKLKKVEKLIEYSKDTAGGIMTLDFMSATPDMTVEQVVEEIRKVSANFHTILYVYVTDERGYFKGAISLRRILISDAKLTVKSLLKRLPEKSILRPNYKIPMVIKVMTKYNLYTAAVVDSSNKLVGVVAIDDVMRHLAPNA